MIKYEYKDAPVERKQELLAEIISKYNIKNKDELVQALGHAQAVLGCNQTEFAKHPLVNISSRTLRTHKSNYEELYKLAVAKFEQQPELADVDAEIEEDVLEQTYQNLLQRLKSPKTQTKDIATILEYFGITKNEFKQFADFRNSTLRAFLADNLTRIIKDEEQTELVKSIIAESPYLYQGTEKSLGNTTNSLSIDLTDSMARLEAQTLGLLFMGLINGRLSGQFNENAETLRMLKKVSGRRLSQPSEFETMDGKVLPPKPLAPDEEKRCIMLFGKEEGQEIYQCLLKLSNNVEKETTLKLPDYEGIVKDDYEAHLKYFPKGKKKGLKQLLAELDAIDNRDVLKDKYKEYLNVNEN